ncbi:MAG: HD domain-containing protein, partial [Candidatus Omnitrophica bacterium]|nr:HD domain-containing protein [Candidatus Omnitrophota bacterium]
AILFLKEVVPVVLHHHEKWNGKGYHSGIKESEIPLLARIVSIADAYQALISDRPYRKAFSKKKAHQILKNETGISYDKDIVDVLIKMETRRNSKSAKKH